MKSVNSFCLFCGSKDNLTKDHIPPINLFPKPRPQNLITFKSCKECNERYSKDEEYFMATVSIRHDVAEHKTASKIVPKVIRAFSNPKKLPFAKSIINNIKLEDLTTPSGIYLGKIPSYKIDLNRIFNVIQKITLGLFFHEFNKVLPKNYIVKVIDSFVLANLPEKEKQMIHSIYNELNTIKSTIIGEEVFSYCYKGFKEDEFCKVWLFKFYESAIFISLTLPDKN